VTQDDEGGSVISMMTNPTLPAYDPQCLHDYLRAAGLKSLRPLWAKLEILFGLAAATLGLVLLRDHAAPDPLSAAVIVLGLYLAGAGHRSHLYQSQNRQTAYLVQLLRSKSNEP